jgi:DNA adenine methylase
VPHFLEAQVKPFLKWPGGKRWGAAIVAEIVRANLSGRYYEPFLGGGAVFFELLPEEAFLSDVNTELIQAYRALKYKHREIRSILQTLPVNRSVYDDLRVNASGNASMKAARFLYLNRTAFGGLYRLNRNGQFNVPFGGGQRNTSLLWKGDLLREAAKALRAAIVERLDFEVAVDMAVKGDVVYCDPTYTVAHDNNGFRRYNEAVFSWADQERLAAAAFRARRRGATVLISNAHHKTVHDLFASGPECTIHTLSRASCIARNPAHRKAVREYLFEYTSKSKLRKDSLK